MFSSPYLSHRSLTAPGDLGSGFFVPGFARCCQLCGISLVFLRGRSHANRSWSLDADLVPFLICPCDVIFAFEFIWKDLQ